MFLTGCNCGLINDIVCEEPPVEAKDTTVGGFFWESIKVSQRLILFLLIL